MLPALLDSLLADPYFRVRPPKSAGREQFGEAYARRLIVAGREASRAARGLGTHGDYAYATFYH